jgi:hypothetical protein
VHPRGKMVESLSRYLKAETRVVGNLGSQLK